jgi:hypothetical protein
MPGPSRLRVGCAPVRTAALAIALSLAVALAACGGGGGGSLSASEYRSKATAICRDHSKQINALAQPKTNAELGDYLAKGTEITHRTVDRFADLDPPDELQANHDAVVKLSREELDLLDGVVADIKGGTDAQTATKKAEAKLNAKEAAVDAKFNALGLSTCARG